MGDRGWLGLPRLKIRSERPIEKLGDQLVSRRQPMPVGFVVEGVDGPRHLPEVVAHVDNGDIVLAAEAFHETLGPGRV
jgi:hypothetical protein